MFHRRWFRVPLVLLLAAALSTAGCGDGSTSDPEPQPQYFLIAYTLESPDDGVSEAAATLRSGITHLTWQPVTNASITVNHLALAAQIQTPGLYVRSPMPLDEGENIALDVVAGALVYETYAVRPASPAITQPAAGDTIPAGATSLVVTWAEAEHAEAYICEVRNMATEARASVRTSSTTAGFPLAGLATPGATLRISVASLNGTFDFEDPRFPDSVYDEPPYFSGFAAIARTVIQVFREP